MESKSGKIIHIFHVPKWGCYSRQQVEAGASIDQHLGDLVVVDDGRHDQGQGPYPDDVVGVIFGSKVMT